ncbi:MAG: hypothetical protein AAF242_05985, partial [Bacteroidota bacterium]
MFWSILKYELKHWLKQPTVYIYFFVFAAIAWFLFVGSAGLFDPPSPANGPQKLLNSPLGIHSYFQYFGKFILFLLPAVLGQGLYRDFSSNTYQLLYSYPIAKWEYWLAKLLSGLLFVFLISTSLGLGLILGEYTPGLDTARLGPLHWSAYIRAYLVHLLPNLFAYGLLVFSIVALSRNIYAGFLSILGLYLLQLIGQNAFVNTPYLIGLFDPFGQNTVAYLTRFWTLTEQNSNHFPITGLMLYNRLFFLGLCTFFAVWVYQKFQLHANPPQVWWNKVRLGQAKKPLTKPNKNVKAPNVNINLSGWSNVVRAWHLGTFHLRTIVGSWLFIILLLLGVLAIIFALGRVTTSGEMTLLPVTRIMLSVPATFFTLIIMVLTFIYSGMLVHKDRSTGMHQLVDSTAASNGLLFASQFFAIIQMQLLLLFTMMIVGIGLQIFQGFYHFEIGLYVYQLFAVQLISLVIWALAAFFVHNLLPNPYLGIFILFLMWMGFANLPQLGIHTRVLAFNSPNQLSYSDINGFGHGLKSYWRLEWYWLSVGLLLVVLGQLIWRRGLLITLFDRLLQAKRRWNSNYTGLVSLLAILILAKGFTLLKEEWKTPSRKVENQRFKKFELEFEQYAGTKQPQIESIDLDIDLFPDQQSFRAKGRYLIKNQGPKMLDTLLIKGGFGERTSFDFNRSVQLIDKDTFIQFFVYQLEQGLAPGDSMELQFTIKNQENTLFERQSNVLENGTFLKSDIFPRLGYFLEEFTKAPDDPAALAINVQYPFADR